MELFQSTYHSKIYKEYRALDPMAHRKLIHFFEENEDAIRRLDNEELYEILTNYTTALFKARSFRKHLQVVDEVLMASIDNSIYFFQGTDVFNKMLFQKAVGLYQTLEYKQSEYILREMIKINPYHKEAIKLLKQCLRKQYPTFVLRTRAASISLFLLTALILLVEVLFVRSFYRQYLDLVELIRNATFGLGLFTLITGDLINKISTERQVDKWVHEIIARKAPLQG